MEEPGEYVINPAAWLKSRLETDEKEQILNSPYFISVANTAEAMIMSGGYPSTAHQVEELIGEAIAFTDKLIEKVGERL